jgi:hypothetical protein
VVDITENALFDPNWTNRVDSPLACLITLSKSNSDLVSRILGRLQTELDSSTHSTAVTMMKQLALSQPSNVVIYNFVLDQLKTAVPRNSTNLVDAVNDILSSAPVPTASLLIATEIMNSLLDMVEESRNKDVMQSTDFFQLLAITCGLLTRILPDQNLMLQRMMTLLDLSPFESKSNCGLAILVPAILGNMKPEVV